MTSKDLSSGEAGSRPEVVRYQLRYPPQVPFAATRPGAITQLREPAQGEGLSTARSQPTRSARTLATPRVRALITLAASLVIVASLSASAAVAARPASRLAPPCLHDAARMSACQLISSYFAALNAGRTQEACSLLGHQLRQETGGANCPSILALSRGTPFQIAGARGVPSRVVVLVKVGLHELDHFRMLGWAAFVGREAGQLRILDTRRT